MVLILVPSAQIALQALAKRAYSKTCSVAAGATMLPEAVALSDRRCVPDANFEPPSSQPLLAEALVTFNRTQKLGARVL